MSGEPSDWNQIFLKAYQRLTHHYGAAFLRSATEDQHRDHVRHWQQVLHSERIRKAEMLETVEAVTRTQRFRTFPPNPAEFVGFVHRRRAEQQYAVPETEEAFRQACGLTVPVHPLVAHVRGRIGSWLLRTRADRDIRRRFVECYEEAAEALSRGALTLPKTEQAEAAPESDRLPAGELSSRLDRLLSPQP